MNSTPTFDADLLRRYDRPGPRYTSYPTAPQFSDRFGEEQFRDILRRSNDDPIPRRLSLYMHVPFCESPCFYCGCNRVITRDKQRGAAYVEELGTEINRVGSLVDRDREAVQVHFGGGTPNFLDSAQIACVMDQLATHFQPSSARDRDFSIELDPRFINRAGVLELAELGFNRASLGVQDFNPVVQQAVNRIQSEEQTAEVIEACRESGFRSVNVDLIYGLPRQSLEGFSATLDRVVQLRPDRLAVYSYAHLPQLFKPQRQIEASDLPTPETKLALLGMAIERLSAAGYVYIGMDHFALPDDDLARAQERGALHRNFMGYTTHADCDLIGLGVSSISHVGDTFSQNPRDLPSYGHALASQRIPTWRGLQMDADDVLRADLIQQLMCHGAIDIRALQERHGIDFPRYFADSIEQLQPLIEDDLVALDASRLQTRPRGRLLLRNIAMCFDRYLREAAPTRFSKAI